MKGAGPARVEGALRAAAAGGVVLDHALAQAVSELAHSRRAAPVRAFPELTDREFDVLSLIAEGMDNQGIARHLVLSPKTVRNHVSNVFPRSTPTTAPTPSSSPAAWASAPERDLGGQRAIRPSGWAP